MFNGKKFVAVSGLLGGLAVACFSAAEAQAAGPGACTLDSGGNIVCTQQVAGQTPEGDSFTLRRTVNCQPTQPVALPAPGLLSNGQTRIGPHITCANAPTPAPATVPAADSDGDRDEASPLLARLLG